MAHISKLCRSHAETVIRRLMRTVEFGDDSNSTAAGKIVLMYGIGAGDSVVSIVTMDDKTEITRMTYGWQDAEPLAIERAPEHVTIDVVVEPIDQAAG